MGRNSFSVSIALMLTLSAVVAAAASASAHVPIYQSGGGTMQDALHIPDSMTSYATYAEFKNDVFNEIQFFSITAAAGQNQHIELDVPAPYSGLAPILMLIGPGLPDPSNDTRYLLEFFSLNLTSGQGALSWNYTGRLDEEEFEPFTQVVLLKRQSVNVTLTEAGEYYILVARSTFIPEPDKQYLIPDAKYILVTGTLEKFTIVDYVLIPYDWVKGHLFWNENPLIFLMPTYVLTAGGLAVTMLMRRMRPTSSAVGSDRRTQAVFYVALGAGFLMVAGGINQMLFLFASPLFSLGLGETIVLVLQGVGIVLGVLSIRLSFALVKPASWTRLLISVVIVAVAFIVGAGFIFGPALFLAAAVVGTFVFRSRAATPS